MRAGLLVPLPCAVSERVSWGFAMLFRGKKEKTDLETVEVYERPSLPKATEAKCRSRKIRIDANEICRE